MLECIGGGWIANSTPLRDHQIDAQEILCVGIVHDLNSAAALLLQQPERFEQAQVGRADVALTSPLQDQENAEGGLPSKQPWPSPLLLRLLQPRSQILTSHLFGFEAGLLIAQPFAE